MPLGKRCQVSVFFFQHFNSKNLKQIMGPLTLKFTKAPSHGRGSSRLNCAAHGFKMAPLARPIFLKMIPLARLISTSKVP